MRAYANASVWVPIAGALILATGCVSPTPKSETMTALGVIAQNKHSGEVQLDVVGGGGPEFRISDEAFEQAVTASLVDSRVFSGVIEKGRATYRLYVILGDLKQPAAGANFTVEMNVLWTLWRGDDTRPVWQSLVRSSDTRGMSDAFNAQNRLRLATEMAARANITEAIRQLSAATF